MTAVQKIKVLCVDDSALIRSLMTEIINSQPDISTASLLGFWHGTPEGQLLNDLAGREPIEDPAELTELADALFQQLLREGPLNQLKQEAALLKAKPYEDLNDAEKQELMRLMREIRSLSGRS